MRSLTPPQRSPVPFIAFRRRYRHCVRNYPNCRPRGRVPQPTHFNRPSMPGTRRNFASRKVSRPSTRRLPQRPGITPRWRSRRRDCSLAKRRHGLGLSPTRARRPPLRGAKNKWSLPNTGGTTCACDGVGLRSPFHRSGHPWGQPASRASQQRPPRSSGTGPRSMPRSATRSA